MGGVVNAIFGGGGGGGGGGSAPAPAPSSQTVSNTSIPSYAQPYVENMLGQTQALTDINQNPYQSYGGSRIAEFSPLQQQAFANVASQTTAGQVNTGTGFSTAAGLGSLGTANQAGGYGNLGAGYGSLAAGMAPAAQQYGQTAADIGLGGIDLSRLGVGYGQQATGYGEAAAGMAPAAQALGRYGVDVGAQGLGYGSQGQMAGQRAARQSSMYGGLGAMQGQEGANIGASLAQQATSPGAVQAYMNPYVQASLQPQLNLLAQQAGIQGAAQQGTATQAGAFGGSRSALANSLVQQNALLAQQQAIGQGYNTAFQNAQNQMAAANQAALAGNAQALQGYGMGLQGAQQAGQLGMQGAGMGLQGVSSALQGQQAGLAGLGQASNLYGQGIQGAQAGMQGVQAGLAGLGTAMQGQQAGLAGLQQAGNLYGQGMTGAQVGLQGVGAQQAGYAGANQAAGTLGQLGQTQFGQQQAINQAQQTTGAVQQAQAQQALDQAYQDFMKQKNYPYQQLAFMSDMLRGLPLSQAAQTQYTAPPNAASQLGGLGMSALGIYGMSGGFKAKGGMVGKGYAEGGLMAAKRYKEGGYADGGQPMAGADVIRQLISMLDNPTLSPQEVEAIEKKIMAYQRMLGNPQSEEIMAPAMGRTGIAAIGTGEMVPEEGMAGGGIVAFAQGGSNLKRPEGEMDYSELIKERLAAMDTGNPFAKSEEQTQAIRQSMEERKARSPYEALAMAGLGTMAGTSQYGLTNLGLGGIEGLKSYSKSAAENAADQKLLLQQQVEAEKGKYARDTGNLNALIQAQSAKDTKALGLLNAKNTAAATSASRDYNNWLKANTIYSNAITAEKRNLYKANKDRFNFDFENSELDAEARANVAKTMPQIVKALELQPEAPVSPVDKGAIKPGSKTAADAPTYMPLPDKKDALVKGKTYNTSKGPAKWDGTQFIPIQVRYGKRFFV